MRCAVLISGRVQGVGFRLYSARQAARLGVGGFARNLPDGRVEVEVEGDRVSVEGLLERLRRGPPGAGVRDLAVRWIASRGEEGFRIE